MDLGTSESDILKILVTKLGISNSEAERYQTNIKFLRKRRVCVAKQAVFAHRIIDAARYSTLESIDSVLHTMPEHVTEEEIEEMKRLANKKYDARIAVYDRGERQWDTDVSMTMVVRGVKPAALL
ncbi:MAG: hypothetical protein HFH73_03155 [Lachnospiraceae bacterium]|nr:hypothetical protein [Lachnospiraceae bacterium]